MGRSGDGKRNLLLGWPYEPLGLEILGLSRELNFGFTNCCSNEGNMTNIWNEAVNSTKSFTAKFVGSPARFAIRKKRVFLFRQSFRRLLRKHMFTLRVQKVMICDFRSVWFALRFVVIVLFRDIIDYFASKIFLIFLDLVTCKNKEMSASFPRQKFHWPSRLPPPFFLSVMSCGPGWASALPPVN